MCQCACSSQPLPATFFKWVDGFWQTRRRSVSPRECRPRNLKTGLSISMNALCCGDVPVTSCLFSQHVPFTLSTHPLRPQKCRQSTKFIIIPSRGWKLFHDAACIQPASRQGPRAMFFLDKTQVFY